MEGCICVLRAELGKSPLEGPHFSFQTHEEHASTTGWADYGGPK